MYFTGDLQQSDQNKARMGDEGYTRLVLQIREKEDVFMGCVWRRLQIWTARSCDVMNLQMASWEDAAPNDFQVVLKK